MSEIKDASDRAITEIGKQSPGANVVILVQDKSGRVHVLHNADDAKVPVFLAQVAVAYQQGSLS